MIWRVLRKVKETSKKSHFEFQFRMASKVTKKQGRGGDGAAYGNSRSFTFQIK